MNGGSDVFVRPPGNVLIKEVKALIAFSLLPSVDVLANQPYFSISISNITVTCAINYHLMKREDENEERDVTWAPWPLGGRGDVTPIPEGTLTFTVPVPWRKCYFYYSFMSFVFTADLRRRLWCLLGSIRRASHVASAAISQWQQLWRVCGL